MIFQFPEHEHMYTSHNWRIRTLHYVAKALGVLFHVDGMPYGADIFRRRKALGAGKS